MGERKDSAILSDARAEDLRAQLAAHDDAVAKARKDELKAKYKNVDKFLKSKELAAVLETSKELTASLASASEDRDLYFALDNIRVGAEALQTTLDNRARAEGLSFDAD
jgi:hypothetical protein